MKITIYRRQTYLVYLKIKNNKYKTVIKLFERKKFPRWILFKTI